MTTARRVVLALGSNLGDRLANLQLGVDLLCAERGLTCEAVSSVYQTAPVGGPEQPDYWNAILLATSDLPARAILAICQSAERAALRVRAARWGPRTLDVDVIACGEESSADPDLTLPHPRAHQRGFVLVPWHEVDPGAQIPGRGTVARLLADTDCAGISRLPDARLVLRSAGGGTGRAPAGGGATRPE